MYVRIYIYIEDMRTKNVLSERTVLVKIANSNFMPTLHGFRWYPYFVAQEQLVAFRGKQMTLAVASERSIFSKNHDCNSYVYIEFSVSR